jgi:hypothetical protein
MALASGVDLLGTDRVDDLREFLLGPPRRDFAPPVQ